MKIALFLYGLFKKKKTMYSVDYQSGFRYTKHFLEDGIAKEKEVDVSEVIFDLENLRKKRRWFRLCLWTFIACLYVAIGDEKFRQEGGIVFVIVLFFLTIYRYIVEPNPNLFINYNLGNKTIKFIQESMISSIANSKKYWLVGGASTISDARNHAGATTCVDRKEIFVRKNKLPLKRLKTNINIPFIDIQTMQLFFLPDRLLLKQKKTITAISYKDIQIDVFYSRFREEGGVPSDAKLIEYTFKHVNNNGTPDRRFSDNPKIPICHYSEYELKVDNTVIAVIMTSKLDAMHEFRDILEKIGNLE
jgi:hypothetical protein